MSKDKNSGLFSRISAWFYINWRFTLLLWLAIVVGGGAVYTNFIKREGFPPIQFPLTVISGTYFVDDVDRVDAEVGVPLSEIIATIPSVESSQVNTGASFFSAVVQFEGDVVPIDGTKALTDAIAAADSLPEQAQLSYTTIDPAAFLNKYDVLLSVYSTDKSTDPAELQAAAESVAAQLQAKDTRITAAEVQKVITGGINPTTGAQETRQTAFGRIGLQENGTTAVYPSITVGVDRDSSQLDIIELSTLLKDVLPTIDLSEFGDSYSVIIGSDFAESITTQISSLEENLLGGLLAVAVVSFLLITWRASVITGLFMISVMAVVIGVLYLIGYSLNTITLFALVLSLGLFVDDATIVVEALDASRKRKKDRVRIVREAVKLVGAASFAGTMTTVLAFAPLLFITGILGEFIRLMPVTIIISLLASLVLSLTLIPLLSKFILFKSSSIDEQIMKYNPVSVFETRLARFAGFLPNLLKTNKKVGRLVAVGMVGMSVVFVLLAGTFAQKLSFNIFPPSKDSDQIGFEVTYPAGTTLPRAEEVADQIDEIVVDEIGENVYRLSYGRQSQPNERSADALIELVPFNEREAKSPELIEKLQTAFDSKLPSDVSVRVVQYDAGPPAEEFPFKAQIFTEDEAKAASLANEIIAYLDGAEIERQNGTTAKVDKTRLPSEQIITRKEGKRVFELQASFDADDTSALVIAAEEYVREKFTAQYLSEAGFAESDLTFDFGQESQNEESFSSLGLVFPLAILSMYILLALQFRSFLQPLLIFMAIPFSLLGVFGGLYLTGNSLSFFAMIGLIGLIGIAVNNTILLTDYANQERRAGAGAIDAIAAASQKRFRPLVTTTLTTVVALLPLALSDPFWEALAFTIIFGLMSSTFLVIFAFPYYYLAAEWLRAKTRRKSRR